jgi:hypothetical protein
MLHRIRIALQQRSFAKMAGTVEVEEGSEAFTDGHAGYRGPEAERTAMRSWTTVGYVEGRVSTKRH